MVAGRETVMAKQAPEMRPTPLLRIWDARAILDMRPKRGGVGRGGPVNSS